MKYSVSWVDGGEPQREQFAVWERNLSGKVPAKLRFQWFYRDNPAGPGRLASLEARDNEGAPAQVVGTAGHGLRVFQVDGAEGPRTLRAALLGDVAVDAAHRSALPAILVMKEMRRLVLGDMDLAYGFPNDKAAALVVKLGYRKLGETRRFALVFRHERLLKPRISSRIVARGAALALDAARAGLVAARAALPLATFRLCWATPVDERFDKLWRDAAPDYPLIGVRDAAFVRWRFLSLATRRGVQLVTMQDRETAELAGYAALEWNGATVRVIDLFAKRPALPGFLRLLCGALMVHGASSISIRLFGAKALVDALGEIGFRPRDDRNTVVCGCGQTSGPEAEALYDPERWYLTDADEDA